MSVAPASKSASADPSAAPSSPDASDDEYEVEYHPVVFDAANELLLTDLLS